MRAYVQLLRERSHFRTLVSAEIISLFGDWFTLVAVSLLTGARGGSPLLLALTLVANVLPPALLGPIAGPLADYVDRRKALIGTAIAQAGVTVAMAFVSARGPLVAIPALVLARGLVGALREPATSATLPSVVDAEELVRANALLAAVWSTSYALGMAAGGFVAGLDPSLAIGIDALSFVVAALLLSRLPRLGAADVSRPASLDTRALLRGMGEGLRVAVRVPALGRAVFRKTPLAFATGAGWMVLVMAAMGAPFAGTAALTIGVLQSVRGVATGVGPLVAERVIAGGADAARTERAVMAITFLAIIGFVFARSPTEWLIGAGVWGMGIGANWVLTTSEIQRRGPKNALGRLAAIDALSWSLGTSLGALTVGLVGNRVTIAALASIGVGILVDRMLAIVFRDAPKPA